MKKTPSDNIFDTLSKQQRIFVDMTYQLLFTDIRAIKLLGGPGSGKSYVTSYVITEFMKNENVLITAPTNKAVLNISNMIDDDEKVNFGIMTIHKALQLKMKSDQAVLQVGTYGNAKDSPMNGCTVCVIDEASMVSIDIVTKIKASMKMNKRLKLIIVGDEDQLYPPGEDCSPLLEFVPKKYTVSLTENKRYPDGCAIDKHVKALKYCLKNKDYRFTFICNDNLARGNLYNVGNMYTFIKKHHKYFDNDQNRLLTWTRSQFKEYNDLIRVEKLGSVIANKHKLIKGERFISYSSNHDQQIFIGDEGVVLSFKNVAFNVDAYKHSKVKIPIINMQVMLDHGIECYINALPKQSYALYNTTKDILYNNALSSQKYRSRELWKKYWGFVNSFHNIEPAYAQTIHSSQGSTFNNVILDVPNIMECSEFETLFRLLIVGTSRAKYVVMINDVIN